MFYDRKRYTIYHEDNPGFEIEEPIEWRKEKKKFVRNPNYHGMTVDMTDVVEFTGSGREALSVILSEYGVNASVKMTVEIRDAQTDIFAVSYVGHVDFLTHVETEYSFKVKFNADPLVTLFKSKENAKVELERMTNLEGDPIPALSKVTLNLAGRDILKTSKLFNFDWVDSSDEPGWPFITAWNNTKVNPVSLDERGVDKEDNLILVTHQVPVGRVSWGGRDNITENEIVEDFFQWNHFGYDITLKCNLDIDQSLMIQTATTTDGPLTDYTFKIRYAFFTGELDAVLVPGKTIDLVSWNLAEGVDMHDLKFSDSRDIVVAQDEWVCLQMYLETSGGGWCRVGASNGYRIDPETNKKIPTYEDANGERADGWCNISLTISENSSRQGSSSDGILIYEYAERLNDIVLGAKFSSTLLGRATMPQYEENGDFYDIALLHGMWARGLTESVAKYKPISTSLKDFFTSLNSVTPIGVEISDDSFIIEKKAYFYQKKILISLGEVVDLEKMSAIKEYNSLITVGYEKAGGYEEESGLDEYNRETQYSTILKTTSNELRLISKYRADSYGLETVRRENPLIGIDVDEDKDSKFDDHIWFLDVDKPSGETNWTTSTWEKRFAEEPKNVYSPETAYNLWFSPINILLRHGGWLKSSLVKYLDSWISYTHSEGNSAIITKQIGGTAYSQNEGIPVADLLNSENKAEIVKFVAPITYAQLKGTTNGIKNIYGLVKFSYKGVLYKGHVMSVEELNGIGTWEVKLFS